MAKSNDGSVEIPLAVKELPAGRLTPKRTDVRLNEAIAWITLAYVPDLEVDHLINLNEVFLVAHVWELTREQVVNMIRGYAFGNGLLHV